jgi:lipopolysaccharide/colanic/teichoic acid biosynthesis glycosyltransferase
VIRRLVDISASGVALIFLSPLFLAIALAIRLSSPGGVVYRARRVGKDGQPFTMFKFRTMVANADRVGPSISGRADNRITPIGKFLRATKLDEIPQFWNVLKGDMTLIGPRPESPEMVKYYTSDQIHVLSVKPGLTGPSQISYTLDESMTVLKTDAAEEFYVNHVLQRRLTIDDMYIRSRSVGNDLAVVWQTLGLLAKAFLRQASRTR